MVPSHTGLMAGEDALLRVGVMLCHVMLCCVVLSVCVCVCWGWGVRGRASDDLYSCKYIPMRICMCGVLLRIYRYTPVEVSSPFFDRKRTKTCQNTRTLASSCCRRASGESQASANEAPSTMLLNSTRRGLHCHIFRDTNLPLVVLLH